MVCGLKFNVPDLAPNATPMPAVPAAAKPPRSTAAPELPGDPGAAKAALTLGGADDDSIELAPDEPIELLPDDPIGLADNEPADPHTEEAVVTATVETEPPQTAADSETSTDVAQPVPEVPPAQPTRPAVQPRSNDTIRETAEEHDPYELSEDPSQSEPAAPLLGLDPLEDLAQSETPEAKIREVPVEVAPAEVEATRHDAPNGAVLVMVGILYVGLAAVLLVLMLKYIGVGITAWLLLPIAAVYGRKISVHLVYLFTAGSIAIG
jgi:hypothetical protein